MKECKKGGETHIPFNASDAECLTFLATGSSSLDAGATDGFPARASRMPVEFYDESRQWLFKMSCLTVIEVKWRSLYFNSY